MNAALKRWLVPPVPRPVLIAVTALTLGGCVTAQEDIRSYTYDYAEPHRLAAERRASQDISDSCYFSGTQYPELVGPLKIARQDGPDGPHFRATQSFYCVGTRGGP